MAESMTDLPNLTPKQYAFVQGILAGKTASDAYRAAYGAEGYADNELWVQASRLRNSPKVSLWLSKARTEALASAVQTKEAYLQETERLKGVCENAQNYGAAVKAHELAGKVMGHYDDKVKGSNLAETLVLADVLARIQTSNPQAAQALASGLGIELDKAQDDVTH